MTNYSFDQPLNRSDRVVRNCVNYGWTSLPIRIDFYQGHINVYRIPVFLNHIEVVFQSCFSPCSDNYLSLVFVRAGMERPCPDLGGENMENLTFLLACMGLIYTKYSYFPTYDKLFQSSMPYQ